MASDNPEDVMYTILLRIEIPEERARQYAKVFIENGVDTAQVIIVFLFLFFLPNPPNLYD
jgi:hypothetical protein